MIGEPAALYVPTAKNESETTTKHLEYMMGTTDDNEQLTKMGYTQELYRGFNGFMSFAFCFTAVSVIPSISLGFTTSVGVGGPAELVWAWIVGSIFCIIAGASMAEISSVYPSAGSVYHWAGQMGPPEWSPITSYICGWFNFLGNMAGDAAFSNGFATCISFAMAIADPNGEPLSVGAQVGISIAVLAAWSVIDFARTDMQGWMNNVAVFWQIFGSVAIVISLLVLSSDRATGSLVFLQGIDTTNYTQTSEAPYLGMQVPSYTVVLGITSCLFAFTGYEAGAHMAEETRDARTAAPRGIMGTVWCCAAVGLLYILGMLFATPDITALTVPVQEIYQGAAGQRGGLGLMVLLIICFFFAGTASTTVTSRIVFALARDGALPLSSLIRPVYAGTKCPVRSILVVFLLDSLFMLLPLVNSSALAAITGTCTVGYQVSYAIPIILRCTVGRSRWRPGVWNLGALSFPIAVVAATWQMATSIIFFLPYVFPVTVDNMNWTVVVVFGTLAIAAANWVLVARHTFRGPKRADSDDRTKCPVTPVSSCAGCHSSAAADAQAGDGFDGPQTLQADVDCDKPASLAADKFDLRQAGDQVMSPFVPSISGVARDAALAEMPPEPEELVGSPCSWEDTDEPEMAKSETRVYMV